MTTTASWTELNQTIADCQTCDRLRRHCQKIAVEKRRAYRDQDYWGKPVPNFGPRKARLLIVGLAPAAHGANRTGRMFSGDRSGTWLFRALHRAGFANQAECDSRDDGLRLIDCAITAICHCAPPDNKPDSSELSNCRPYLVKTIDLVRPRIFLALGGLAWNAMIQVARERNWISQTGARPKFGHGIQLPLDIPRRRQPVWMIGSYHPSQQNTFTGRLTESMFDSIFAEIRSRIDE